MGILKGKQKQFFVENGYLVVENAVDQSLLSELQSDFAEWVEQSRSESDSWGSTIDDKPRFNVEPGHCAESPALRRVNAPVEVSEAYFRAMSDSAMTDMVAELIGPDLKFHHSKINSKQPGGNTEVKWHQDFTFTPHTNDDIVTALLMVDDVTANNGPLEVLPGSHRGPLHSLWHDGVFTGAVEKSIADTSALRAERCLGNAGSVCLMHSRLLHASASNLSSSSRTLFICVYTAEDAVPVSLSPMPNQYEGLMVRGKRSGQVRSVDYQMTLPELPKTGVFFDQQTESTQN